MTTDSTNKLIRNGSAASTDSGVIGQDESHGSQQTSPNNSLTPSQRMSWPDFKHTAETSHMSASCSDLTKPQVGMFIGVAVIGQEILHKSSCKNVNIFLSFLGGSKEGMGSGSPPPPEKTQKYTDS